MKRRDFLHQSCFACLAAGAGISLLGLESCASTKVFSAAPENGQLKVDISQFEPESNALIVRTKALEHDILILKTGEKYRAIYLQCSHQNNPVNYTGSKIVCNAHGSQFDLDGLVKVGPADKHLKKIKIEKENTLLTLSINE